TGVENSGWLAFIAAMAGMGAMPAVAASKVASVMHCARAVMRASARKASNLASPERGRAGGGGVAGMRTAGAGGGGFGAVWAQATATNIVARVTSRRNPGKGSARK